MLKKNSQKTPLLKSISQTLESLRDWFTRSSKEKSTSSNRLIYQNHGNYTEGLILGRLILRPAYGSQSTEMIIGSCVQSITKQGKQLTITLGLSTPIVYPFEYKPPMETLAVRNGFKSSPKKESTSPRSTKKQG